MAVTTDGEGNISGKCYSSYYNYNDVLNPTAGDYPASLVTDATFTQITDKTINFSSSVTENTFFVENGKVVAQYATESDKLALRILDSGNTYTIKTSIPVTISDSYNTRTYNISSGDIEISATANYQELTNGTVNLSSSNTYVTAAGNNISCNSNGNGITVSVNNGTVTLGGLNSGYTDSETNNWIQRDEFQVGSDIYTVLDNGITKKVSTGNYTANTFIHSKADSLTLSDTNWTQVQPVTNQQYIYDSIPLSDKTISVIDESGKIIAEINGNTLTKKDNSATNYYVVIGENAAAGTYTIPAEFNKFSGSLKIPEYNMTGYFPYEITTKDNAQNYSMKLDAAGNVAFDTTNIKSVKYENEGAGFTCTFDNDKGIATKTTTSGNVYTQAITNNSFAVAELLTDETVSILGLTDNWNLYNGTATVTDSLTIYGGKELYVSGGTATATVTNGAVESVNLTGNGAAVKYKPQTYGYFYYAHISGMDDAAVTVNYDDGYNYTVSGIDNGETLKICGSTDGNSVYNILTATAISGTISATITVSDSGAVSISSVSGLTAGDKFNCAYTEYEVLQNGILYLPAGYSQNRLYQLNEGTVDFTNYLSASPIQSATINDETINYIDFSTNDKVYVDATAKIIAESKDGTLIKKDDTATNYYLCPTEGTIPSDFTKIYYGGNLFTVEPSGDDYTFGYGDDGNFIFDTTKITKITSQTENFEFTFENGVALKRSTDDTNITYGQAFSNNQFIVDQLVTFATIEDWEEENNWGLYSGEVTVTNSLKIYDGTTLSVDTGEITATVTNGALTNISDIDASETVTYGEKSLSVSSGKISATVDGGKIKTVSSTARQLLHTTKKLYKLQAALLQIMTTAIWQISAA